MIVVEAGTAIVEPDGDVTEMAADMPTGRPETGTCTTAGNAMYARLLVTLSPAFTLTLRVAGVTPNVPSGVRTLRAAMVYTPGTRPPSVVDAVTVCVKSFGPVTSTSATSPAARPETEIPRLPGATPAE